MLVNFNPIPRYIGNPFFPRVVVFTTGSDGKISDEEFKKKVLKLIQQHVDHAVKNKPADKKFDDLIPELKESIKKMVGDIVDTMKTEDTKISVSAAPAPAGSASKYVKGDSLVNELNSEINNILNNIQ